MKITLLIFLNVKKVDWIVEQEVLKVEVVAEDQVGKKNQEILK